MEIAVLGAGTYGCYTINSILTKYPNANITLFDVGNKSIKNEKEIGYNSSLKKELYKGLSDGRFFGHGGTSDKWGGQLLTYTENDFKHPDGFMKDVIKYDVLYKEEMLSKFKISNDYSEKHVSDDLFTKSGVWLSMLHRNFYKWFNIGKRKRVKVLSNCRIVKFKSKDGSHIDSIQYMRNGQEEEAIFDYYFLTSGAFESSRILLYSGMIPENKIYFSDHLSQPVFRIKKTTIIGNEDFVFKMRGTSLITKRMIGEIDDCSFYIHPVFNLKFPFFQCIKEVLFKRHFELNYIRSLFMDIPKIIGFIWAVIFLRRMYVMNNEWTLNIDIENPSKESYVTLSKNTDEFGLPGLDVYYEAGEKAEVLFEKAKKIAMRHLNSCNVDYVPLFEHFSINTCEDIYHPYGMLHFKSGNDYFTHWDNLLVVTTGCLSRSGGINPTASMFPMIDEFINNHFSCTK